MRSYSERWVYARMIGTGFQAGMFTRIRIFIPICQGTVTSWTRHTRSTGIPFVAAVGGWVVISANTLAKFAHLIASGGRWNGKQLLSPEYVIGHGGGNGSGVAGESRFYTGFAIVSTDGIDFRDPFLPSEFFIGPVDLSPTRQRFRD